MRAALGLALLIGVYAALVFATAAGKFVDQLGKQLRHDRADALRPAGSAGDFKTSHSTRVTEGVQRDHA